MSTPNETNKWPYFLRPGRNFVELADPSPASGSDSDMAIGLARTYRCDGHSAWTRSLSVARCSFSVLALLQQQGGLGAQHVVRWSREQIGDTLSITQMPLDCDPSIDAVGDGAYVAWEPWTRDDVASQWPARPELERAQAELTS
jgi:hypothetical protein